jgi:hypothetical protein
MSPIHQAIREGFDEALTDEAVAHEDVPTVVYKHLIRQFPALKQFGDQIQGLLKEQIKTINT